MAPHRRPVPDLGDLDDAILLKCFSLLTPLPDLFNVAASCRRFRDLALDRRSWLYVTHAANAEAPSPAPRQSRRQPTPPAALPDGLGSPAGASQDDAPHWFRSRFATLAAAVAASRPGDTILLEPGPAAHLVEAPVVVPHPLHILGGGTAPEACVLRGAPGLDAVVDFWASGRLANLTVQAVSGACVGHTRGRLTVQGCQLECDARGLPHLVAPLLTRAISWPHSHTAASPPLATPAGGAPAPAHAGSKRPAPSLTSGDSSAAAAEPPAAKRQREWRRGADAAAGAGVLSVSETRIKARGSAVELRGSGRLSAVRAIYRYSHTLVWLEVNSADSEAGHSCSGAAASAGGHAAEAAAGPSGGGHAMPATPLPSWAERAAAAGFDPAAFQRRVAALLAPPAAAGGEAGQPAAAAEDAAGDGGMERKAEEWCTRHHAALASPPTPAAATPAGQ